MSSNWPYPSNTTTMISGMEGLAYPKYVPTPGEYTQGFYEVLDYVNDWSDWLPTGDAIATSTWTAQTGLTIRDGGHSDTTTTVWVSGGNEESCYWAMNLVTTTGGRTGQRTLQFRIKGHPHHRYTPLSGHGSLTATTV